MCAQLDALQTSWQHRKASWLAQHKKHLRVKDKYMQLLTMVQTELGSRKQERTAELVSDGHEDLELLTPPLCSESRLDATIRPVARGYSREAKKERSDGASADCADNPAPTNVLLNSGRLIPGHTSRTARLDTPDNPCAMIFEDNNCNALEPRPKPAKSKAQSPKLGRGTKPLEFEFDACLRPYTGPTFGSKRRDR